MEGKVTTKMSYSFINCGKFLAFASMDASESILFEKRLRL